MGKTVLVTGAAGFIGSHLTERLVRDGHEVRALVRYNGRDDRGHLDRLEPEIQRAVEVHRGDLKDPEAVRKAALDVDIPPGGTIQGYGVKFYRPGTPLSGQNERSTPVVMQNAGEHISVVWPSNIKTQEPVLPLPASSVYAMR